MAHMRGCGAVSGNGSVSQANYWQPPHPWGSEEPNVGPICIPSDHLKLWCVCIFGTSGYVCIYIHIYICLKMNEHSIYIYIRIHKYMYSYHSVAEAPSGCQFLRAARSSWL